MHLSYRVITELNTQVRRLGYVSQLLRFVGRRALSRDALVAKLIDWSKSQKDYLEKYLDSTGAVHPEKQKKSIAAANRYIDFTVSLGLLSKISNVYRLTRLGSVLFSLLKDNFTDGRNPFFLQESERVFYLYQLLQHDADILLTVIEMVQSSERAPLKNLQDNFQEAFSNRLKAKIAAGSQEHIKRLLLERQTEIKTIWKNPRRYAEHIVPPRLHWGLDLGLLKLVSEKNSIIYELTEAGKRTMEVLPKLLHSLKPDVTDEWLQTHVFSSVCPLLIPNCQFLRWKDIDEMIHMEVCQKYLLDAFYEFKKNNIPKISLAQGLLYLCLRLIINSHLLTDQTDLLEWFYIPRILGAHKYEIRTSARENEAYFIMIHP